MGDLFGDKADPEAQTRIKICGITNAADAEAAIDAGTDALGFNFFAGSARYIDMQSAKEWITELPTHVRRVGVLVNPTLEESINVARSGFIDALQLHGDESPSFCQKLADRGIVFAKAVGVRDERSLRNLPSFFTTTLLLDSHSAHFGGSGESFPWILATEFVHQHPDFKVILAGGLTPRNVEQAIRAVHPFAVDVTSGVEASPGRKDIARIRAFIEAVRQLSA